MSFFFSNEFMDSLYQGPRFIISYIPCFQKMEHIVNAQSVVSECTEVRSSWLTLRNIINIWKLHALLSGNGRKWEQLEVDESMYVCLVTFLYDQLLCICRHLLFLRSQNSNLSLLVIFKKIYVFLIYKLAQYFELLWALLQKPGYIFNPIGQKTKATSKRKSPY